MKRIVAIAIVVAALPLLSLASNADAVAPWARPLAGKTIKAVAIAPSFGMWDFEWLGSQIDIELVFFDAETLIRGDEESGKRFAKALDDGPSIIFVAGAITATLPEPVQSAIAASVERGSGVLFSTYGAPFDGTLGDIARSCTPQEDTGDIIRGSGASTTPEWRAGPSFLRTGIRGEGRALLLSYDGSAPSSHVLLPSFTAPMEAARDHLDTYASVLTKAVRWVSKRDPVVFVERIERIAPVPPGESEIPPDLPREFVEQSTDAGRLAPGEMYRIVLNGAAPETYRVRARLRGIGRSQFQLLEPTRIWRKSAQDYLLHFLAPPGPMLLDVWLLDGDRVADWYTEPIDMNWWPRIQSMTLSKRYLASNDGLDIAVSLVPDVQESQTATAYVRAVDNFGRVVSESQTPVAAGTEDARLHLEFVDLIGNMVKIETYFVLGPPRQLSVLELPMASFAHAYLPVYHTAPVTRFMLAVQCAVSPEYALRDRLMSLSKTGFDAVFTTPGNVQGLYSSENNLDPVPIVPLGSVPVADPEDCVAEMRRLPAAMGQLQASVDLQWHAGPQRVGFAEGEELTSLTRSMQPGSTCLTVFQEWLRENYGDIGTINAVWGTTFAAWDSIDLASVESSGTTSLAWLVDLQDFHNSVYARYTGESIQRARSVISGVRLGAVLPSTADAHGFDWTAMPFSRSALCPVAGPEIKTSRYAMIRLEPHGLHGAAAWQLWSAALHGFAGVCATNSPGPSADPAETWLLAPDGTPNSIASAAAATASTLRSGFDALFSSSSPFDSGVSLYANAVSDTIAGKNPEEYDAPRSRDAFAALLENFGISCSVLYGHESPGAVPDHVAVLVLPGVVALSDAEAGMIHAFLDRGGSILADRLPGLYDERGMRRTQPALEDVFGARWTPESNWVSAPATRFTATGESAGYDVNVDGRVRGEDAETPLCHVYAAATRSALWNYNAWDEAGVEAAETGEQVRLWRRDVYGVLCELGARPALAAGNDTVFDGNFDRLRLVRGPVDILSVVRRPDSERDPARIEFELDAARHAYDARNGLLLNSKKPFTAKLAPGDAVIVSQLPYRVKEVRVDCPSEVFFGDRLFFRASVVADGAVPGNHLLQVTLSTTEGIELEHYGKTLEAGTGSVESYIPIARNEAPGTYLLAVKDVLTGMKTLANVEVLSTAGKPRVKTNFN